MRDPLRKGEEMWCERRWSAPTEPLALCATALWSAVSFFRRDAYFDAHARLMASAGLPFP